MQALYPLFLDLSGEACLVVGGGTVAERKVAPLIHSGADVTVVAPRVGDGLRQLAVEGRIRWQERPYHPGEAGDYFLVVAASDDRSVNAQVSREAQRAGRLVNVVDQPDLSNVYAPALLRRGELQIAVSTSGACPALAKKLRDEMADRYPASYQRLLVRLRQFRERLARELPDPSARRTILERVMRSDQLTQFLEGEEAPLEALLKQCVS